MADANRAYEAGDAAALQRILDEYQDGADQAEGEGIGAELIRIIRQISRAKDRVSAIELDWPPCSKAKSHYSRGRPRRTSKLAETF
jgi:hypothetical protein